MNFFLKLLSLPFRKYQPNHRMSFTVGKYTVKIADTPEEIFQLLRLRYKIFQNKIWGRWLPLLDMTPYEMDGDHLIVKEGSEILGTYRLRSSKFTNSFYSESFFDLSDLLKHRFSFLELGRACITPQRRQGLVLSCLWRGIIRYGKEVKADCIFGCVSVQTEEPRVAAAVLSYLEKTNLLSSVISIKPLTKVKTFENHRGARGHEEKIPPLFSSYLRMGCKVYGDPAYDTHLKCFDYFTMLQLKEIDPLYEKRLS